MRNQKQLINAVNLVAKKGQKWNDGVQTLLVEIATFSFVHGNNAVANHLIKSFDGVNVEKLAKWLYATRIFRMDKGELVINNGNRKEMLNTHTAEQFEAFVAGLPVWYAKETETENEDSAQRVFDGLALAENLIKKLANATKKGEGKHLDVERYLRAALEQYKADRAIFETLATAGE